MISPLSAGAIARKVVGKVSGFREVLSFNPSSLGFRLPPQVSMGIQVANSLGLRVPTEAQMVQLATGKLDLVLKGVRRDVLATLERQQSQIFQAADSVDKVLNSIEWLQ